MRSVIALAFVLLVAMSGCLELEGSTDGNWVIEAERVDVTAGVPVHEVTRDELARNDDVLELVEEAYETGQGQIFVTETEARAAIRFIERYEAFEPEINRRDRPSGVYFVYRNRTIVVEDAIHDVTQG